MIGALAGIGLPGTATAVLLLLVVGSTLPPVASAILLASPATSGLGLVLAGWLYMKVAERTIELPMTKAGVT
jgi:hypothetical protein